MCNISRALLKNKSTLFRGANPTVGWCRNHPGGAHGNTWSWSQGGKWMDKPKWKSWVKSWSNDSSKKIWLIWRFWNRTSKINHLLVNQKWQGRALYFVTVAEKTVQVDAVPTATAAVTDPAAQVERLSAQISRLWLACSYCLCSTPSIKGKKFNMIKLEVEETDACFILSFCFFKFQPCCASHFGCCLGHPLLLICCSPAVSKVCGGGEGLGRFCPQSLGRALCLIPGDGLIGCRRSCLT